MGQLLAVDLGSVEPGHQAVAPLGDLTLDLLLEVSDHLAEGLGRHHWLVGLRACSIWWVQV